MPKLLTQQCFKCQKIIVAAIMINESTYCGNCSIITKTDSKKNSVLSDLELSSMSY